MTIKVHHLLEGTEISIYWCHPKCEEYPQFDEYFDKYAHEKARNVRLPVSKGRVCWPGSGGYWNEAETSLVTKVQE